MLQALVFLSAAFVISGREHGEHKCSKNWPGPCLVQVPEYVYSCRQSGEARTKLLVCASEDAQSVKCALDVGPYETIKEVAVISQLSSAACEKGSSYFVEGASLVVKSGCAATFKVTTTKDAGKCNAAQEEIQKGCAGAVQELEKCAPEVNKFCSPAVLQNQNLQLKTEQTASWVPEEFWRFVPQEIPLWTQRAWLPAESQKGLFTLQLSLCLQEHAEDLSSECSDTEMMKFLKTHTMKNFEESARLAVQRSAKVGIVIGIVGIVIIVLASIWFVAGCLYFWRQYKLLKAKRAASKPRTGRWATGLFTWDWRSLVPACLFPWFQSALNQAEVHGRDAHVADVAMNLGLSQMVANTYLTRQAIRDRHGLPLEPIRDFFASLFCLPCAMAQHTRQLDRHLEEVSNLSQSPSDDDSVPNLKVASDMV